MTAVFLRRYLSRATGLLAGTGVGRTTRKADNGAGFHPATRPTSPLDAFWAEDETSPYDLVAEHAQQRGRTLAEFVLWLEWRCEACGWSTTMAAPGFAGDGTYHYPDGSTPCGPLHARRASALTVTASLWEDADRLLEDVAVELRKARERFPSFNSPHEGYAVILEELDELWEHVKANTACTLAGRREAIQVAAMAMRFALDCPPTARSQQDDVDSALARLEAANRG